MNCEGRLEQAPIIHEGTVFGEHEEGGEWPIGTYTPHPTGDWGWDVDCPECGIVSREKLIIVSYWFSPHEELSADYGEPIELTGLVCSGCNTLICVSRVTQIPVNRDMGYLQNIRTQERIRVTGGLQHFINTHRLSGAAENPPDFSKAEWDKFIGEVYRAND